ncbi:MAG: GNAT family N-acetyltransferase [Silvanigrellaceae bacterium]|nr:GNAT family N-acetyltransferase [Silvanigrellaceae bacterium]
MDFTEEELAKFPTLDEVEKEIETKCLHLRCPTATNTDILKNLWLNKDVRKFLGGTVADENILEKKLISLQEHWCQHGFGQWSVCKKETGQIIGICGLHYSENGLEQSYMFFPEFWSQGFATEATFASLTYGFKILKLARVVAITQEANKNSCRLLEKIGMYHVNSLVRFDAKQRIYELTQEQWRHHKK